MSEQSASFPTLSNFLNGRHPEKLADLSDEEFWRYAREMARTPSSPPQESEYLKCALDAGYCLLPLASVREVTLAPRSLTPIPASPPSLLGLTSWRGEAIAVVDLATYLARAKQRREIGPHASLLIAQNDYATLGMTAIVISSTCPLQADSIRPLPPAAPDAGPPLSGIIGVYEDAFVLDVSAILTAMVDQIKHIQ